MAKIPTGATESFSYNSLECIYFDFLSVYIKDQIKMMITYLIDYTMAKIYY